MMLLLVLAALVGSKPSEAVNSKCVVDYSESLSLSYEQFDQAEKAGWRPLANLAQCRKIAADLIGKYLKEKWKNLTPPQVHVLYWHEGQILALLKDQSAVPFLLSGIDPDNDDIDFSDYAIGTVAFLQKDLPALKAARNRLAAKPIPAWYAQARTLALGKQQVFPDWPLNLDVLDGFIACFGRSYEEAYSATCRTHDGRH